MNLDPRALDGLLEESQDLQADAMRPTSETLDELVDLHRSDPHGDVAENLAFHDVHRGGSGPVWGPRPC